MAGGGSRFRRAFSRGLWAVALVVVSGCGTFDFGRMPLMPGTRWQVTAVDEQVIVNNDLLLALEQDGEHATLRGNCGSSQFQVVYHTDGALQFFLMVPGQNDMPDGCAEDDLLQESLVAGALQTSNGWETNGNAVLLNGDQSVRLEPAEN